MQSTSQRNFVDRMHDQDFEILFKDLEAWKILKKISILKFKFWYPQTIVVEQL